MVRTIDVKELKSRLAQDPTAMVIDVRTPAEFSAAHVPQARNFPFGQVEPGQVLKAHAAVRNLPMYVICETGARSRRMAQELDRAGVAEVLDVAGGTQAWQAAGFSVARLRGGNTRRVISLERQVRIAAGLLVLVGVALGFGLHTAGHGLAAVVGVGLVFAGATDFCGMGRFLARMPWNR